MNCLAIRGQVCKRTSYNGNYRKNYTGVGCTYDAQRDAFISSKPYASWTLNEDTCRWISPILEPDDSVTNGGTKMYEWDKATNTWMNIL